MRVLVLGGTGEARALAAALVADGDEVLTSLAGRVSNPALPVGQVRIGGFGGIDGLREAAAAFDVVVDATHPFAATISAHAALACPELLRLQRPGWEPLGDWREVADHGEAGAAAPSVARPVLTVGRQSLAAFRDHVAHRAALVRVVEAPPAGEVPPAWSLLRDRGPYDVAGETTLMREHGIDVLVTKDSGGAMTRPKIDAAAALGVPVIVVRRPAVPPGATCVDDVAAARRWVRARGGRRPGPVVRDAARP
ncbi:cobalt-precorrin-6A reductase [Nocardioides sp. R-C-SC26]|uniref:cobalt-precorrin-6A reductase n=1 Tax=Nocardioides sp. R-C-SC26 TaxID=2870414 RepID=UPI0027DF2237|nr:cobalt-precorrin-6A reductase [Nocardioides sp. R-C-SC26]